MEKDFNFGNKSGFFYKSSAHPCAQKKHALLNNTSPSPNNQVEH